jgi:hypothetical protein
VDAFAMAEARLGAIGLWQRVAAVALALQQLQRAARGGGGVAGQGETGATSKT